MVKVLFRYSDSVWRGIRGAFVVGLVKVFDPSQS
jgi:hypothetical protein